jgi:hypothetical protein
MVLPFMMDIFLDNNNWKEQSARISCKKMSFWTVSLVIGSVFFSFALIAPSHCIPDQNIFDLLVLSCIFPAICEEIVFRGWLFHSLKVSLNMSTAAVLTSVCFGLAHPWKGWLPLITFSAFSCCWIFANLRAKSMTPSLAAHLVHNFVVTILVKLVPALCRTPPLVSICLWVAGTLICCMAIEVEMKETIVPKALLDGEIQGNRIRPFEQSGLL